MMQGILVSAVQTLVYAIGGVLTGWFAYSQGLRDGRKERD